MVEHLLSLAIWVPIMVGIFVLGIGKQRPCIARWFALFGASINLLLSLPLYTRFSLLHSGIQFQEFYPWIPSLNIHYHLGVDGLSVFFVLLNNLITLLIIIGAWQSIQQRIAQYMAAFLIMSGLINGAFSALDAILFYVFFEAILIPMYLIIGIWGGPNRVYAAIKFFLYTFLGSLCALIAFIYLYYRTNGSFEISEFYNLRLSMNTQIFMFLAFFLAFSVKVPMWPVHTWLPDAHVEAPTGGSMILAAVMLKLGAYGFLRFMLPIVPDACRHYAWILVAFSLIAITYIGLVTLVQTDMKRLVAYSSISHMGLVTLGIFMFSAGSLNAYAVEGALFHMISHGFISAALFYCIGILYDRMHTRKIADYGGVANQMPVFSIFFVLFAMANLGLPGTSSFVGELLIILGAVQVNWAYAACAASTLLLSAAYMLWMIKRIVFGEIANADVAELKDLNAREFGVLAVLAMIVLGIGLYPRVVTDLLHPSVHYLVHLASQTRLL